METKRKIILKVKSLDVYYGKKQILHSVSTEYRKKDTVLIIGPNGAGKSTFLKAISGLISSKNGSIFLYKRDIGRYPVDKVVNEGIVYLLQTNNIFPSYTVLDNLQIAGYFLKKTEFQRVMEKVFTIFPNIKDKVNTLAGLLSGGERQALAISMVLMRKPKVLLLDEPLAGLSPKTASDLIRFLQKVYDFFKVELICFVEHKVKLSINYANRVQVLSQGKIKLDKYIANYTDKNLLIEEIEDVYFRKD